ncbi:hypothetical protein [Roseateles microcysteis]|uniref:hypothetical protein n=1 Tax=Roseateles microcysteis TaxID=3119057 RepID=UPI002FE5282F
MRFTIVYRGRIPSVGTAEQISKIRKDVYLQAQLAALSRVTSQKLDAKNRQILGDTCYRAILPISWVCAIEVILLRATPATQIGGLPDIDNTLKTLFDALCAPSGPSHPQGSDFSQELHVLAIEDKQLSSITVSADHHWGGSSDGDMTVIRVTTQETDIDDSVALGGQSFASIRRNVF